MYTYWWFSTFGYKYVFQKIVFKLCKTFSIKKEEKNFSRYLGLNISKNKNNHVTINQSGYINELNKIIIEPSRKHQRLEPVKLNEPNMVRAKIRQIIWMSNHSCLDVSCNISFLTSKSKVANVKDLLTVDKVINKIKDN